VAVRRISNLFRDSAFVGVFSNYQPRRRNDKMAAINSSATDRRISASQFHALRFPFRFEIRGIAMLHSLIVIIRQN